MAAGGGRPVSAPEPGPRRLLPALLACGILLGRAGDEPPHEPPPDPPPIANVRYTEDYGYLQEEDPAATEALSPWAPLKYLRLNAAGDIYLTLGAELRLRYERYEDNNWGDGPQDKDGYLWERVLPLVDLHVGEHFRFFGQLISAFAFDLDVPESPVDEDSLDALQLFADGRLPLGGDENAAVTLRPGRQLLTYGSGRLIDVRYGPNVLQAFDAAKTFIETETWRCDAFYARPVDHRSDAFDDRIGEDESLWSVYGTLKPRPGAPLGLDLYYIGYLNQDSPFVEPSSRELRHTLGARPFGSTDGWDWDFELFYQFGDLATDGGDGTISAWSVASNTGYTFAELPLGPRFALRADVISGDHDPGDRDVETFNPLFPKGKYFGELTPIGPANLIHLNPHISVQLTKRLQFTGSLGFYWRESLDDGVYALGGMELLRPDGGSDARYIGTQAEALLEFQLDRHFSASVSYSVFTAGEFIRDTGDDETIHFVGVEAMYRF
jgi:hypothetical protein